MTKAVLFDLDDTLFDHRGAARAALRAVHESFASDVDFHAFELHHAHYLEEMHLEVLAGRVTLDDARRERFRRVFAALGVRLDPADVHRVAASYRQGYAGTRAPVAGASELLAYLHSSARIAIVTNNLLDEQREKLEMCGLTAHVDALVASEDVGVSKPHPGIFDIALERLSVSSAEAVMVGDSWQNDIEGAVAAGIRAVWFNPERRPQPAQPGGVMSLQRLTPVEVVAATILSRD